MKTALIHLNTPDAVFAGVALKRDDAGRLSLTDLWQAAGRRKDARPSDWLSLPSTSGFIAAAARFLNTDKSGIIQTSRGRNGGTFGNVQVALEYAQYLDPNLAVAVNATFIERAEEERNPDKALDRTVAIYERRGFTPEKIAERLSGKAARLIFTNTLARHGVKEVGYAMCTRAVYRPLFGGDGSSATVLARLNVTARAAKPRDHMSPMHLAAVRFAELAGAEAIEANSLRGNQACAAACEAASKQVAAVVRSARKNFA